METELGMKKCCHLVDISWNYNLPTSAYWHLQFKRPVGQLKTVALRKGPEAGIAEMNTKHNLCSRSQFQRSIFLTSFKERKKEKRKRTQTATGKDAPHPEVLQEWRWSKWQQEIKPHLTEWPSSQSASRTWRREPGDDGNPLHVPWEQTLASLLKGQPAQGRTNRSRELNES